MVRWGLNAAKEEEEAEGEAHSGMHASGPCSKVKTIVVVYGVLNGRRIMMVFILYGGFCRF